MIKDLGSNYEGFFIRKIGEGFSEVPEGFILDEKEGTKVLLFPGRYKNFRICTDHSIGSVAIYVSKCWDKMFLEGGSGICKGYEGDSYLRLFYLPVEDTFIAEIDGMITAVIPEGKTLYIGIDKDHLLHIENIRDRLKFTGSRDILDEETNQVILSNLD